MSLERSDTSSEAVTTEDSEPVTTEEDQILESIARLRVEIDRIESTTGPSKRTHCIRAEIERLEIRLAHCKIEASEQADPISQIEPGNQ